MKINELLKYGESVLHEAGIEDCKNDAKILLMDLLDLDYSAYFMKMNDDLTESDIEKYKSMIAKRKTHYPCQYITGVQNFMGYDFFVEEGVLIPRSETELLVEAAVNKSEAKNLRVLDLCTGSGCIGISYSLLRKEKGYNDIVDLVDISDKAIEVSSTNNSKLEARCNIIQSDLFNNIFDKYDIIISNPPYIESSEIENLMEEVQFFEPRLALDGTDDGLYFYRKIIDKARNYLNNNSTVLFEIGYNQYEAVKMLFEEAGYYDVELIKDYAGLDRIVIARYS